MNILGAPTPCSSLEWVKTKAYVCCTQECPCNEFAELTRLSSLRRTGSPLDRRFSSKPTLSCFWWRCLDVIWLGQAFSVTFGFHFDGSVVWGYWEGQLARQLMRISKSVLSLLSRKTAPLGCLLPLSDRVWQECLTWLSEPRKTGGRITQENQPSAQQNRNKIEAVYFPRAAQCAVTCSKRLMPTLICVHSVKSRDLGRAPPGKGSVDYVNTEQRWGWGVFRQTKSLWEATILELQGKT